MSNFASLLSGGHPNSLGRTLDVVDLILAHPQRLDELYQCYFSPDEVVRLRVSNAMKRICQQHPDWLIPYIQRFLTEIALIQQASTQWTLAQLCLMLEDALSPTQKQDATTLFLHNLLHWQDWIVLTQTMETLTHWASTDPSLAQELMPQLKRLAQDPRKAVAAKAQKSLHILLKRYPPSK